MVVYIVIIVLLLVLVNLLLCLICFIVIGVYAQEKHSVCSLVLSRSSGITGGLGAYPLWRAEDYYILTMDYTGKLNKN